MGHNWPSSVNVGRESRRHGRKWGQHHLTSAASGQICAAPRRPATGPPPPPPGRTDCPPACPPAGPPDRPPAPIARTDRLADRWPDDATNRPDRPGHRTDGAPRCPKRSPRQSARSDRQPQGRPGPRSRQTARPTRPPDGPPPPGRPRPATCPTAQRPRLTPHGLRTAACAAATLRSTARGPRRHCGGFEAGNGPRAGCGGCGGKADRTGMDGTTAA